MEAVINTKIELIDITNNYLLDAGFTKELYTITDYDDREYIEVTFVAIKAVDYIIKDIKKTKYKKLIEIKKYKLCKDYYLAVITLK